MDISGTVIQSKQATQTTKTRFRSIKELNDQLKKTQSRPVWKRSFTAQSLQMQRVMHRVYDTAAYSLYSISVILRILGERTNKRDQVDELEELIRDRIKTLSDQLAEDRAHFEKSANEFGLTELPTFTNAKTYNIEISSPLEMKMIILFEEVDQYLALVNMMWGFDVFTGHRWSQKLFDWQQRLIRLASRIIEIERQSRKAIQQTDDHDLREQVENIAPSADDVVDSIELDTPQKEHAEA